MRYAILIGLLALSCASAAPPPGVGTARDRAYTDRKPEDLDFEHRTKLRWRAKLATDPERGKWMQFAGRLVQLERVPILRDRVIWVQVTTVRTSGNVTLICHVEDERDLSALVRNAQVNGEGVVGEVGESGIVLRPCELGASTP